MTIKEYTNLKKVHFLFIKNRIDSIYVLRDEKLVGIIHPEDLCALNENIISMIFYLFKKSPLNLKHSNSYSL